MSYFIPAVSSGWGGASPAPAPSSGGSTPAPSPSPAAPVVCDCCEQIHRVTGVQKFAPGTQYTVGDRVYSPSNCIVYERYDPTTPVGGWRIYNNANSTGVPSDEYDTGLLACRALATEIGHDPATVHVSDTGQIDPPNAMYCYGASPNFPPVLGLVYRPPKTISAAELLVDPASLPEFWRAMKLTRGAWEER